MFGGCTRLSFDLDLISINPHQINPAAPKPRSIKLHKKPTQQSKYNYITVVNFTNRKMTSTDLCSTLQQRTFQRHQLSILQSFFNRRFHFIRVQVLSLLQGIHQHLKRRIRKIGRAA